MENELFDTSIYNSSASVDNTPPNTPAEKRKEDTITADPTPQTDIIAPWSRSSDAVTNAVNNFSSGKATMDELISTFNMAADIIINAVDDVRGRIFLTILHHAENHLVHVSYGQFVQGNGERKKFIGKSDYYALRNYYERRAQLSDELKAYIDKSTITNAKNLLNMPDVNDAKIKIIQNEYPNAIPCKNKFVKLLLPPTPSKIKKPKGKPRCMSLRNIKYVYQTTDKNTNRILNSLDVLHSDCAKNQVLRQKYDDFNAEITAILADLQESAKRTTTTKNRKEDALI